MFLVMLATGCKFVIAVLNYEALLMRTHGGSWLTPESQRGLIPAPAYRDRYVPTGRRIVHVESPERLKFILTTVHSCQKVP